MAVVPSERVQIWVCLLLYGWYYPSMGLQIWVFLICVIFQRIAKGAGGKGPRQKKRKNRQKASKSFSTLFDNFRAGQKRSKIVKKCQKYFRLFFFRQFSRGTSFPAPFGWLWILPYSNGAVQIRVGLELADGGSSKTTSRRSPCQTPVRPHGHLKPFPMSSVALLLLWLLSGRLIFIHLQCWEVLPFCRFQRQRCIKVRVLRAHDFYAPLALKTAKGQHLPALEVYKKRSPICLGFRGLIRTRGFEKGKCCGLGIAPGEKGPCSGLAP